MSVEVVPLIAADTSLRIDWPNQMVSFIAVSCQLLWLIVVYLNRHWPQLGSESVGRKLDAEKVKGGVCSYDPVSAFRTGFWPDQREFHELKYRISCCWSGTVYKTWRYGRCQLVTFQSSHSSHTSNMKVSCSRTLPSQLLRELILDLLSCSSPSS